MVIPSKTESAVIVAPVGFNEEDCMMITDTLCQLPVIFKPKIKPRTKEQMTPFNHQFYLYCVRKKINPFDHFFDEMGLIIAGTGLFGGIYQDYNTAYSKTEPKTSSLDKDHEHKLAIDELNKKEVP